MRKRRHEQQNERRRRERNGNLARGSHRPTGPTGPPGVRSPAHRPGPGRAPAGRPLTCVAEQDGQEDESVRCAEHDDAEVHAEVEDAEQLRLGEGEHRDAAELRQRDAAQHLQGAPRTHATDVRTARKKTKPKNS